MSADPRQVLAVRAAVREVVFAVSLKPTNRGKAGNDFFMMLGSQADARAQPRVGAHDPLPGSRGEGWRQLRVGDTDRKSTRLNSSHLVISYAVFCLKKKKIGRTLQATAAHD